MQTFTTAPRLPAALRWYTTLRTPARNPVVGLPCTRDGPGAVGRFRNHIGRIDFNFCQRGSARTDDRRGAESWTTIDSGRAAAVRSATQKNPDPLKNGFKSGHPKQAAVKTWRSLELGISFRHLPPPASRQPLHVPTDATKRKLCSIADRAAEHVSGLH